MQKKFLIGTAASTVILSVQGYAQDQSELYLDELSGMLSDLDQNCPAIVEKLDGLAHDTIEAVCANDQGLIDSDSDLRLLVNLASRIQNSSTDLCVIRDLQSMVGNRELLPPSKNKVSNSNKK